MLEILGTLVLFLLTMVSYSSGVTLAARRRAYEPVVLDLLLVVLLFVVMFWFRPQFGRLPMLGMTIGLGVLVGYLVGTIRLAGVKESQKIPESELPEHAREKSVTVVEGNLFKRGWQRWSDFAERMGTVQGRIIMGFFYFIFITPLGLVGRLFTDALSIKKLPPNSNWHSKETVDVTIDAAQEQG